MKIALELATEGMLSGQGYYSLSTATVGHLFIAEETVEEVIEKAVSSGGSKRSPYKITYKEKEFKITDDLLYLEDDDIMVIIKVFLECQ